MKNIRFDKIILLLFAVLFSINIVNASQSEIDNAKKNTEEYCEDDIQKKGCVYDPTNTLYTQSGKIENCNFYSCLTSGSDTQLVRGYQDSDANGNLVFAGCYKVKLNSTGEYFDNGDYYAFKIVTPDKNGNNCSVADSDIVPAKGLKSYGQELFGAIKFALDPYDGHDAIGDDMATYDWLAKEGGECPLMFGLTANSRWYTANEHRYVFTDDASGFSTLPKSFWGGEQYEATPACTILDTKGYQEAKACFDGALEKINKYTCPTDIVSLTSLTDKLAPYQTQCDSKYQTLYSKGLLEENAEEFSNSLKTAAKNKINECFYAKCELTDTDIEKINQKLVGKSCAKGCSSETDTACISCLNQVYKDAGLSTTKMNCLIENEAEKTQTTETVESDVDGQFDEQVDNKLEENKNKREEIENYQFELKMPGGGGFGTNNDTCSSLLGANLTKIVKLCITIVRIAGAVIAIINGMLALLPALASKDADALKKAERKCIYMAIILVLIGILPSLIHIIGNMFNYDLSCF